MRHAFSPATRFLLVTTLTFGAACGDESDSGGAAEGEGEPIAGEGEGEPAPTPGEGEGEPAPTPGEGEGEAPAGEGEGEAPLGEGEGEPAAGATSFTSADVDEEPGGGPRRDLDAPEDDAEGEGGGDEGPVVEEGDIYRVLDGSLILNLNAYRGLQVIDFSDPEDPAIVGRLQITGSPVEMYVFEGRAVVLLNGWRGYYGGCDDVLPDVWEGGLAVSVDLADPTAPEVLDRERVPGWIRTSRLVRDGGDAAVYIASQRWGMFPLEGGDEREEGEPDGPGGDDGEPVDPDDPDAGGGSDEHGDEPAMAWQSRTFVSSWSLGDDGGLTSVAEIDLGGYVTDIQATPRVLMVAQHDWRWRENRSSVAVIDIGSASGEMDLGDEVPTRGMVRGKHNMNMHGDVLRIVSAGVWNRTRTNHVETFDASDLSDITPIDHDTFGDGEDLFATLFLGNKAFFVTYLRVDPFHAYHIDDEGVITPKAEFIVSGWNNFFRPVFDASRLIGIGVNDEDGRTMAVSLYDITDLDNPDPLLARSEVDVSHSWSEAAWDDRAFSVLEGVVDVRSARDEADETGLVLLPFTGWDEESERHVAAVQIFTFSETTLTRRGLMDHGTPVRRTFQAADDMPANLSEEELSLFDCSDPDAPAELGRVALAPNYSDFLVFGDHGVRMEDTRGWWGWWRGGHRQAPPGRLDVVSLADHPDVAEPVASIEAPAAATAYRAGDLLVTVESGWVKVDGEPDEGEPDHEMETRLAVHDLSNPAAPQAGGALVTRDLPGGWGGGWWGGPEDDVEGDFWAPWWGGGHEIHVVGDALVFVEREQHQRLLGVEEVCRIWPEGNHPDGCREGEPGPDPDDPDRGGDEEAREDCVFWSGAITCRRLDDGPQVCEGGFEECRHGPDGGWECVPVDPDDVRKRRECHEWDRYRHWQTFTLHPVDLTDPAAPSLAPAVAMDDDQEAVSLLADGARLYASWREPIDDPADPRGRVRHHFTRFDLSDPADVGVGEPVNIPGQLIAVEEDAGTLFTRDHVWGDGVVETALNRLRLRPDGLAELEARRRMRGQHVQTVLRDGAGHLLVSHRRHWAHWRPEVDDEAERGQRLSVLDADSEGLAVLSESHVDDWAHLQTALAGRALLSVPGGVLVMNLDDPASPYAQAYFPTRGWPSRFEVADRNAYFAAGRYGIYAFGLDEFNLLAVE